MSKASDFLNDILEVNKFKKGDKVLLKNRKGVFDIESTIQGDTRKNPNNIGVLDYLVGEYPREEWVPEFNIKLSK